MKKITNNPERGPLANCIALHDFAETAPDFKNWFLYIVELFGKSALTPTRMALTTKNYDGKHTISYKTGRKKLEASDYQDVIFLALYAHPPVWGTDMSDGIFSVVLQCAKPDTLVLCFDDQLIKFQKDIFTKLTKDSADFFAPRYGYCYQRPFKKGPDCYPVGICVDLDWGDEEAKELTRWRNEYRMSDGSYKTGDLRDIYPMNLLSEAHKQNQVKGKPFFDWIQESPDHGTLTQLSDTLWAWWVDDIPAVREALRQTGWVICI